MARYTGPRGKVCRRLGVPMSHITGKDPDKDPVARRPYPPGAHGPGYRAKVSDFGKRLREKQKLRLYYGIMEKQCRRYYHKASKQKGNTGDNMLCLLEQRLDSLVLRLGLATSIRQARQLVAHGHININGIRAKTPSHHVHPGNVISVREKSRNMAIIADSIQRNKARRLPSYLEFDEKGLEGKLTSAPDRAEIPVQIEDNLIVEYYAQRA